MAADLDSNVEDWGDYELWEKIEIRMRKRKRWIVAAAVLLFLILSAVPVVMDRQPRWQAYRVARGLTQILSGVKTRAAADAVAYRVTVAPDLSLVVEKATAESVRCTQTGAGLWSAVDMSADGQMAQWLAQAQGFGIALLPMDIAQAQGLDRATNQFCYEPIAVDAAPATGGARADGIGLLPRADLETERFDRLVVLGWHDASAQFSLD